MRISIHALLLTAFLLLPTLSGCSSNETSESTAETPASEVSHDDHGEDEHADHDHGVETASSEHQHGEWWCTEHGVPEDECALCKTSLIAGFKEKGDWCEEHNRPDSQCFTCNPENFEAFAARYEAKYGKQPPKPTS